MDYGLDDGSDVYDSEEEELEKERLKQTKSQGQNIGKMFQKQHLANANKRKDANVVGWQNAPKQKNFIVIF